VSATDQQERSIERRQRERTTLRGGALDAIEEVDAVIDGVS
jgi:hypothetical protein